MNGHRSEKIFFIACAGEHWTKWIIRKDRTEITCFACACSSLTREVVSWLHLSKMIWTTCNQILEKNHLASIISTLALLSIHSLHWAAITMGRPELSCFLLLLSTLSSTPLSMSAGKVFLLRCFENGVPLAIVGGRHLVVACVRSPANCYQVIGLAVVVNLLQ